MPKLTLPVSSIKPYLNKAAVFISRAKLGIKPEFGCLFLRDDKAYVYNGETGAIITLPFSVPQPQPTMLFPFDLLRVVNANKDESQITLDFDYPKMSCSVTSPVLDIKIRLIDPTGFTEQQIPKDLRPLTVEALHRKVNAAVFCTSDDASLPLLQGICISTKSVCSTDQRVVWREVGGASEAFVMPRLIAEHIQRLAIEPTGLGINDNTIFVFYPDMVAFGSRLVEDTKYPKVDTVLDTITAQPKAATIKYDREAFRERLTVLLELPAIDNGIKMKCQKGALTVENIVQDDTEGGLSLDVSSTDDFQDVIVNGKLLLNAVEHFNQFAVLADGRRLLFWNDTQELCLSRRGA